MVLLRVCVVNLNRFQSLAVIPAFRRLFVFPAMKEMRQFFSVHLNIERSLLAVDHIQGDGLNSSLVVSFIGEGDLCSGPCRCRNRGFQVRAVLIIIADSVILIQNELRIHIRCHQDFQIRCFFCHQIHQMISGHRYNCSGLYEHRDGRKVHRNLDLFSCLIWHSCPEIIELHVLIFRLGQIYLPGLCPLLHNICDQKAVSPHEADSFVPGLLILLEGHEQGLHERQARHMCAIHQGVQVRTHLVAKINGILDVLLLVAVHPGLRHGIVRICGVNGETRHENSVLHPSHEQLRLRRYSVEASNIAAGIGHTGKSGAKNGGNVVLQRFPAGQVVARPDLCIPLNAGVTGTADRERPDLRIVFRDCLVGELAHQVAHHRLHGADGASFALEIHAAVLVHHGVILTVIVPDGFTSVFQQILCDVFLPVLSRRFLCIIDKIALSAPPGSDSRFFLRAVLHEHVLVLHLLKERMNKKHARLNVGRDHNASLFHLCKPACRILEPVIIPGKAASLDALLGFHSAVTGGKLKAVCRNSFFPSGINEIQNRIIRILRKLRIIHRGAKIAKCSLGKHHRLSGQIRIALYHLANRRPRDQEQIQISCIRAEGGIAMPVVPLLPSHVKGAFCRRVVEISNRLLLCPLQLDIKRDMLIKRVCFCRIVAHGITGCHVHKLFRLIDFSGFLSETIEAVLRFYLTGVKSSFIGILPIGKIRNIRMNLRSLGIINADTEGILFHLNAELFSLDHRFVCAVRQLRLCGFHSPAIILHQLVRPGIPGCHYQTVGCLIPVSVKPRANSKDFIR